MVLEEGWLTSVIEGLRDKGHDVRIAFPRGFAIVIGLTRRDVASAFGSSRKGFGWPTSIGNVLDCLNWKMFDRLLLFWIGAHHIPLLTSRSLSQRSGNELYFKAEHLQRSGAFKFRGAFHALSRIHVAGAASTVVTQSSNNHAQALSLAGQILGLQVHVVMPEEAPEVKRRGH